jgi:hypothetical protein
MKPIKLSNANLDLIDLSRFDKYLMPKYRISHNNGGYGFYEKSGVEHYKMLAYLSTLMDNETILDIGTYQGGSALALSYNKNNKIVSIDIKHQVETNIDLDNIEFLEGDILRSEDGKELIESSNFILYDTVHDGDTELEFHNHLVNSNWEGLCLWDDIKYRWTGAIREGMQSFWNSIDDDKKIDLTKYGHWTGTGLVWYGKKPEIILE